jgi:predicted dinucleotide-binding enzyme
MNGQVRIIRELYRRGHTHGLDSRSRSFEWNPTGRMIRSLPVSTTAGEELAKKLPDAHVVKAFSTIPASFIPHAFYRPVQLQRLVVFYCGDHRLSKVAVRQMIADSGFVGLDAGPLWLARELEAPGRIKDRK